jgi:hypothetical protein
MLPKTEAEEGVLFKPPKSIAIMAFGFLCASSLLYVAKIM